MIKKYEKAISIKDTVNTPLYQLCESLNLIDFEKELEDLLLEYLLPELIELFKKNKSRLHSGFIINHAHNVPVNDVDIFLSKPEDFREIVGDIHKILKKNSIDYKIIDREVYVTFYYKLGKTEVILEIDSVFGGTKEDSFNNCDAKLSAICYEFAERKIYFTENSLKSLHSKTINIQNANYPDVMFYRVVKKERYGYKHTQQDLALVLLHIINLGIKSETVDDFLENIKIINDGTIPIYTQLDGFLKSKEFKEKQKISPEKTFLDLFFDDFDLGF